MKKITKLDFKVMLITLVVFLSHQQIGQTQDLKIVEDQETIITDRIEAGEKAEVLSSVNKTLNKYNTYASLFDSEEQLVTEEYINQFRYLFKSNARVLDDFREYPRELLEDTEYVEKIYNLLRDQGLQYNIKYALLKSIDYDPTGYYEVVVMVEKYIYNYVDSEGEIGISESGRFMPLNITFDISNKDLSYAPILRIAPANPTAPPADYVTTIGAFLTGGYILSSPNASEKGTSYFGESLNGNFNSLGSLPVTFGLGVDFTTNKIINPKKASKKPIYLRLGALWQQAQINGTIENYKYEYEEVTQSEITSQNYIRMVDVHGFEEATTVNMLQGLIGVEYEVLKNYSTSLRINAGWQPTFVIGTSSSVEGNATYDGLIPEMQLRFLKDLSANDNNEAFETFSVGENIQIQNEQPLNLSTSLQNQVYASIAFRKDLVTDVPIIGLLVDVGYSFNLNSFINQNTESERMLNFANDISNSVFQDFYEDVRMHNISLRIGVYYKLITSP